MGASCMAVCVFLMMFLSAWSFIFLFIFAIMPSRRVWARAQSLSMRVFATCLSWMTTDVFLGSCVFGILDFPFTSEEGRTLARAIAMPYAVSLRLVPAWPMGMHTRSKQPQYRRRAKRRVGTSRSSFVEAEVHANADLEEDEGAVLAVERVLVRGVVRWHSAGVDDLRGSCRSCRPCDV